jgi:hypothetical protein
MDLKKLFKEKDRRSIYRRLTEDEELNLRLAIEKISLLKREALNAQRSAAEVDGWAIDPRLHEKIALLHRFHLEVSDIPAAGL